MSRNRTYHFSIERKGRFDYIKATCGVGEPLVSEIYQSPTSSIPSENTLTDTGVIIVRNVETRKIVTMYIASTGQAVALYRTATNGKRLPDWLFEQVLDNQLLRANQP